MISGVASESLLPILSAGHFNLTTRNFSKAVTRRTPLLVGFSANSCYKCIAAEAAYDQASKQLVTLGVAFGRADADRLRDRLAELGATSLPAIGVYLSRRPPRLYDGPHTAECIIEYATKLKSPAVQRIESNAELEAFLSSGSNRTWMAQTFVVGFFREEEDEYDEFLEVAESWQSSKDTYFGQVTGDLALEAVDAGIIDRTPGVVVRRRSDQVMETGSLDAIQLSEFVETRSLPLVGELTANNFGQYEKLLRPMFLLFLDLRGHDRSNASRFVGGLSGSLYNNDLVAEVSAVARDESFRDRVAFAYCDGILYADRMKALGLFGGKERLPALAFNTNERGVAAPYPESLPVDRANLRDFVAAFLSKRLRTKQDTEKFAIAKQQRPLAGDFMPQRQPRRAAPEERVGVSEQFGPSSKGVAARGKVDAVFELTVSNFNDIALDDSKDCMIMFHSANCANCAHLAVYYKKVAERFREEGIESLVVARFDTTDAAPPVALALVAAELPTILFLPAYDKRPPYTFYSGLSKVQPIMRWAEQVASIRFSLPDLCHLSPEDRELYKQQVTDIERAKRKEASSGDL